MKTDSPPTKVLEKLVSDGFKHTGFIAGEGQLHYYQTATEGIIYDKRRDMIVARYVIHHIPSNRKV